MNGPNKSVSMHALSQLSNGASGRKKGLGLISRPSIDQSAGSGLGAFARNGIVEASIRPSLIPPRSNQSLFFCFLFYFWGLFVTFQLATGYGGEKRSSINVSCREASDQLDVDLNDVGASDQTASPTFAASES